MSKKIVTNLLLWICCSFLSVQAQTKSYQYKRALTGIKDDWHNITLPNQIFKHTQTALADVRIYGIKKQDTVEIPYLIKQRNTILKENETSLKLINQSSKGNSYYYTIQPQNTTSLNQIKLFFKQSNFDWKIDLEASNDQLEWFKLLSNYRILSIRNKATNYQFTDLNFNTAKYNYYRIAIKAGEQPTLNEVKIVKVDTINGQYNVIPYQTYQLTNNVETKQSFIELSLPSPAPVSSLQLLIPSKTDYYRNLNIAFATNSFKTEKGIQYNYATLYTGTLSSLEKQQIEFNPTLLKHLKITIDNEDNQPLRISGVSLKGPIYQLLARFDEQFDEYALYYGNKTASAPNYELKNFDHKAPSIVNEIALGKELKNPAYTTTIKEPLFKSKAWLWALMGLIISLLGFFAFKLLKE